jgi:hypothetical protein
MRKQKENYTMVRVEKDIRDRLKTYKNRYSSYSEVISMLLEEYEKPIRKVEELVRLSKEHKG